jgi:hypothetical protein
MGGKMMKSNEQRVMRESTYWVSACTTILLVLTLTLPSSAQNATGRITGVVTDPQGAAVPGAKVRVTNAGTNVRWDTVTNADGVYQVLDLPIGNYKVAVEREGFAKTVTDAQALEINQTLRIDIRMKVGAISETVSVEAQAAQVETANPTLGSTVTGATIQNLPLNGRNTLDLALTQPGVVPIADDIGAYGVSNGGSNGFGGISVAGGRGDAVTYLLDGGSNNRVTSNQVVFNPNPEAVEEFRLLENNYTAEYGRNGGGTITEVIKSGTNSLHGSLFDYLRNDAFNANRFFNKVAQPFQPTPVLKRNQFGGTIGGPITLPKLVNGKDRFFFFFGYQGQRQTATETLSSVTVYTPAQLSGDFSNGGTPGNCPNADTGVATFLQGHPSYQANPGAAACGIIDPTKINSVARAMIAAGLIPSSANGQITPQGRAKYDFNQYLGKFDFYATTNDRISLTLGSNKEPISIPFFGANIPGFSAAQTTWDYFANVGYTKTFSAAMLNEFHAVGQRWYQTTVPSSHPPALASYGINVQSDDPFGPPQIFFSSGMIVGFDPNVKWKADNSYSFTDTLTWNKGRHTWKFGGLFGIMQENSVYAFQTNGAFNFHGALGNGGIGSGNDLADFLFGAPDTYSQFSKAPSNEHQKQYAAFAQDEWKVTPRLTLTLGLRYEYTTPETDTRGFTFSIIPGLQSKRFVNAPLGLVFPGDRGAPSGWYFPDRKNFAPRVGFAWDPFGNGKTSVRGGFGIFYDTLNGWMSDWSTDEPPFAGGASFSFTPNLIPANGPSTILSDPYGTAGLVDPFPSKIPPPANVDFVAAGFLPGFGPSNNFVDVHLKTPYIYQYNLSVQRQIGNGLMAEVGYAGSSSHKLVTWVDQNPLIPGTNNGLVNQAEGLPASTYSFMPTFAGINNANYNGLLASLTKRESNVRYLGQVFFTLSYTWSHNLDNGSGFNSRLAYIPFFNHHRFYGNSDFDIRQRLTFGGGWELPFAGAWSSGPKRLTAGWNLYPIFFIQSGIPLDFLAGVSQFAGAGPSGAGDGEIVRANQTTSSVQAVDPHTPYFLISDPGKADDLSLVTTCPSGAQCLGPNNYWFAPSAFQPAACIGLGTCPLGFYGTYGRNSFHGPRRVNLDMALEKATNLVGEQVKLIFRAEAFNILNHAEFRPPADTTATSGTFGQISATYDPRILQLALRLTF